MRTPPANLIDASLSAALHCTARLTACSTVHSPCGRQRLTATLDQIRLLLLDKGSESVMSF